MADGVSSAGLPDALLACFKDEITKILEYAAPDEATAFDLFGNDVIQECAQTTLRPAMSSKGPTFEFSAALEVGLVTIHLVAGTLALIETLQRIKVRGEEKALESSIRTEWTQFLIAQGMSEPLAIKIPIKFSLELAVFLAKYKIGQS
jgi:hypothetical protein